MEELEYGTIPAGEIDSIAPLWEKLRRHHIEHAGSFKSFYENKDWAGRKAELTAKARLETHTVSVQGVLRGYCVAAIDGDGKGEIESLYVEPELRGEGVGAELFSRCMGWLEREGGKNITIHVMVGNEEVLPFYEKFGYAPRTYYLKKKPEV
ncbi:MAG: GNAT family N-acetyltransferase [Brevinematales bacterium]|nr:GNAT family N-acetyltransferase [Brevinematales bacterium]